MKAINQLVHFLEKELAISGKAISLALRNCEQTPNFLAITLWQYGLITLDQLAQIFDWLEEAGGTGHGAGEKLFPSPLSSPASSPCPMPNNQF